MRRLGALGRLSFGVVSDGCRERWRWRAYSPRGSPPRFHWPLAGVRGSAEAVGQLVAKFGKKRYLVSLADAIAPFDAELAFAVLDGIDAPPVLRAALQLRIEGDEKAGSSISALIRQGEQQRFPELLLLATNALGGDPAVQFAALE